MKTEEVEFLANTIERASTSESVGGALKSGSIVEPDFPLPPPVDPLVVRMGVSASNTPRRRAWALGLLPCKLSLYEILILEMGNNPKGSR